MSLKTIEQNRAEFAHSKIMEVKNWNDKNKRNEYISHLRGISAMIIQNGFGQALAFLRAKGKQDWNDPYNILYKQINEWLSKMNKNEKNFDVLEKIRNGNNDTYRLYTKESLAVLSWLRKFAEAELSEEQQN